MCGIVGYINKEKNVLTSRELIKFFQQALLCDALRGMHGTGVLSVDHKGNESLYKKPINAFDFLELSRTKKIIEDTDNVFVVGHNRWATTGSHSIDNSHPFNHGHITMVHNGSLSGGYRLLSKLNFQVDSEYICHALSKTFDPKEVLEQISGSYSLVWYNSDNKTLNFARNSERPMYIAQVKGKKSHVFGSESGLIQWISSRNQIELEEAWSLKPGILFTIPLDAEEIASSTQFKVKENIIYPSNDYSYYNYGSKSESINPKKIELQSLKKYDYVQVTANSFKPYTINDKDSNPRGNLICNTLSGAIVKINITQEESLNYIGKDIYVTIQSVTHDGEGYATLYKSGIKKNTGVASSTTGSSVIPFVNFNKTPNKGTKNMSIKIFNKKTKYGCSLCSEDLNWSKKDLVYWTDNEEPLCPECYEAYSSTNTTIL